MRAPVLDLDVDALLAQRRRVEAGKAIGARDGEHANRARLDKRREPGEAVEAHRYLPAEDRRPQFAAAGERDVVDAAGIHADRIRDQARRGSARCRRPIRHPMRSTRAAP